MITKIDYVECETDPDQTGWYINDYKDIQALNMQTPIDAVGPFATKTAALRMLAKTPEPEAPKRKPYDPAHDIPNEIDAD
jgi:hypothetical protein